MTATAVKILIETCGRCGGQVVGDNMASGRPWQHVDRPDDHHVVFGTPAPEGHLSEAPSALDALEALLAEEEDDLTAGLPPGGTPRKAHPDELAGGMVSMTNTALKAGFVVDSTICRGPSKIAKHHDPRGYRLVDSCLVGFKHPDGRAACAVWERLAEVEEPTFKFVFAFVKRGGMQSSTALRSYLKGA